MTGNIPIGDGHGSLLTFANPSGKAFSLKIGSVVSAEVMEVIDSGLVALRITPPAGRAEAMRGMVIRARSELPLARGQRMVLEYVGGGREIRMRFLGLEVPGSAPAGKTQALPGGRLSSAETGAILRMFRAVPETLKDAYPHLRAMERLMPPVGELGGKGLRRLVEGSGVLLETRLRLAAEGAGEDLKAVLLKTAGTLRDRAAGEALRAEGLKPREMAEVVERFIRHIESFQLASRADGALHTFPPFQWEDLRDGEFRFGRRDRDDGDACTCDIHLDLETLGELSVSVTWFKGAFYVTFSAERASSRELIASGKAALKERLAAQGLAVGAININRGGASSSSTSPGVDLRV